MICWFCSSETTAEPVGDAEPICKDGPCDICVAVSNLDEEINRTTATLRRLLLKRCDLRSRQNRAHDRMHRLPVELVNYTFQFALDGWDQVVKNPLTIMPTRLASVCRGWRDITWSNPFFWSAIRINISSRSDSSHWPNFVLDWCLRSQKLPLTFHIYDKFRDLLAVDLDVIFDSVLQYSDRWQSLSLRLSSWIVETFINRIDSRHRPILRSLEITSDNRPAYYPTYSTILPSNSNSDAKWSPEKIQICRMALSSLQISWNDLMSADITSCPLDELIQLFQHASQMTDCRITSPGTHTSSSGLVIHPRLKMLSLIGEQDILTRLTLPCLQEFSTDKISSLLPRYLPALVRRSSCPLTKITFVACIGDSVVDGVAPLPGVTDLKVVGESFRSSQEEIQKMFNYFPDLRNLTLCMEPSSVLWDIIPILLDRKPLEGPNQTRLRKLEVVYYAPAHDYDRINSDVGKKLKGLDDIDIIWKKNGFVLEYTGFD